MLHYIMLIFCTNFVFTILGMETKIRVAMVKETTGVVKLSDKQRALPLKTFLERYDESDELFAEVKAMLTPKEDK